MKRYIGVLLVAVVFLGISLSNVNAAQPKWCKDGKSIKFAGATWDSASFYTQLAKTIVEAGYDCKVEVISGSKNVTETALVSGDLEIWMEQWQGQNVITKDAAEAGKIKLIGDLLDGGTLEGWFVPDYVVHGDAKRGIKAVAPDLKNVSDLVKYKQLFDDPEQPGKGRFLNCPTGWECEKTNSQKIKAYKLTADYTNFRPGTGGALDAEITSAVNRGKPILFYYWSPSSILGKYNFYQLQEPAFNEKCWKTLYNSKVNNPCGSAYPSTKLVIGVSIDFYNSASEIVAFLDKLQLQSKDLNGAIAEVGDKKITIEGAVDKFLKNKSSVWRKWVPNDVAKKIASKY